MRNLLKYVLTILFMLSIVSISWGQCAINVTAPQAGATLGCGNNNITWLSYNTSGL